MAVPGKGLQVMKARSPRGNKAYADNNISIEMGEKIY